MTEPEAARRIVIVGGGLAGLSAAVTLAEAREHESRLRITLLESRPRLGGRAASIIDRETGQAIDNCQHVSMGCCTAFQDFLRRTGCDDLFVTQSELHFVAPPTHDGRAPRIVPFRAGPWPAPLHLAGSLLRFPWFGWRDVLRIGTAMNALARAGSGPDEAFQDWLTRHGQSEFLQRNFWHLVLVSALSESLDRISLKHARKVFVDGFLKHADAWRVAIPSVPLDELYETRLRTWLTQRGVELRVRAGAARLVLDDSRIAHVEQRSGEVLTADEFILAVPHGLVLSLLPEQIATHPSLAGTARLESAAISGVHLWYDRPVTELPHAVLLDRLSQWMFNRSLLSRSAGPLKEDGGQHLQVVISAIGTLTESEILSTVTAELAEVFPAARTARVLHHRAITEHSAVFAPLPGVDDLRPDQQSPVSNLQLAGDWTRTGWPSTMEGAVRSGRMAAENVLRRWNLPLPGPLPELPVSRLSRWLYGL